MAVALVMTFFHLFMLGSYHAHLMMRKALKPFLRPSDNEKIFRKGVAGDIEALQKAWNAQQNHPGLLVNLERAYIKAERLEEANILQSHLEKLLPTHPITAKLASVLNRDSEHLVKRAHASDFLTSKEIPKQVECPSN
jgi:hypothetical protein